MIRADEKRKTISNVYKRENRAMIEAKWILMVHQHCQCIQFCYGHVNDYNNKFNFFLDIHGIETALNILLEPREN